MILQGRLVHVPDVTKGLEWYKKAFPMAHAIYLKNSDFTILNIEGFHLEIVKADMKVSSGKKGTVLYWSTNNINETLEYFYTIGAKLYRGPLNIENNLVMCQIEDPFGNLIGLRGKCT